MAGKITHATFAEDLYKKLDIENINLEQFKTYSISPDFFFGYKSLGKLIHRKNVNLLF